jgi:hypothetical protein
MEITRILLIFLCLACIVFVAFRVRTLWQCWTGLLVVCGHRCFYVCGYAADDLLGVSSPQILDRRGKVFLASGNQVRRLRKSELRTWLFEDELRATERNFKRYMKICVVRENMKLPTESGETLEIGDRRDVFR